MYSVCDVVRDAVAQSHLCACPNDKLPQCKGVTKAPPKCSVFHVAKLQDTKFKWKYTLDPLKAQKLSQIDKDIEKDAITLKLIYGIELSPEDLEWWKMQRCLINKKTGAKGGQFANKYLERQDLELLGYSPTPIIGGDFMFTALPDKVLRTIPVAWDRFLNPAMMIFFLIILLCVIFGIFYVLVRNTLRRKQKSKQHQMEIKRFIKEKEQDPYIHTSFESWPADPNKEWKDLIPVYEAQGYCMADYRKKLGMPPGPNC